MKRSLEAVSCSGFDGKQEGFADGVEAAVTVEEHVWLPAEGPLELGPLGVLR